MTNLPYGLMATLVADHQRELHQMASRWRLRRDRRRPAQPNSPGEGRVFRDLSPNIPVRAAV
jgi:hypothetical protein